MTEVVEGEVMELEPVAGSETLTPVVGGASIDMQVATAKQWPRSIDRGLKKARTLATLDEEAAASCIYALPRGGKMIEGPSTRLAEIMAHSWGNLRIDADVVGEDETHLTAEAACLDLETNVAIRVRVKRRITDKQGRRFNDDMIGVTSNAAISIALRNCIFRTIPAVFTNQVYKAARQAAMGQGGTLTRNRQAALNWFGKLSVQPEQVFALLDVEGIEDIGEAELSTLRGLVTAIKAGETSIEEIFAAELEQDDSAGDDTGELEGSEDQESVDGSAQEPTITDADISF